MSKKAPKKPVKKSSPPKAKPNHFKPAKPVPKKSAKPAPKTTKPAKAVAAPKPAPTVKAVPGKETAARASLRSRILAQSRAKGPARPIAFSLDEARAAAKAAATIEEHTKAEAAKVAAKSTKLPDEAGLARLTQPKHVKAASLADILGFNPKKTPTPLEEDDSAIPEKFRRHYKLLLDLRLHLTGQLDQHTEDTLKRSSKDDAGDLSGYGQHMADAGTDTFDRDFALSMVANEQEALSEIEAAIQRVKAGTYGICEVTQKPIARERLLAVPFTRYSAEALKEIEKNRLHTRSQAGLGSELSDGEPMGGGGGDDNGE